GKNASAEAAELGEDAEEAEAALRARNHERRDETSEPRPADSNSGLAPFAPRSVGDGRQSEDDDVASAFEPTEQENEEKAKK
ncbi:hypothetical protein RCL06_24780, partial [Salmonella enterica subsp. enterica serovar Typhimurium]